jgi:hypothetical protein
MVRPNSMTTTPSAYSAARVDVLLDEHGGQSALGLLPEELHHVSDDRRC